MRKPFLSFFTKNTESSKPTFGQHRAEQLHQRLEQALKERKKLARAEASSSDHFKTTYQQKANLTERKIDRLTAEISDAKK